jgi:hypothetical protein
MVSDNPIPQPLLADQARPQAAQPRQLDADALLQASRRVDWRFLLPDPNLRQVAYIGQPRGTLVDSLRLFSAALTLAEPASAGLSAQYDVVVASRPSLGELGRSASLLKPGGFLYVEAYGPFSLRWRRSGGLRFAADYVGAVERLGLVEAEAYWHWPNFESCAEIVPLSDRDALRLAFGRRRSGTGARLKSALGRVLLRSGLFARLVPCFSIVARKPDED